MTGLRTKPRWRICPRTGADGAPLGCGRRFQGLGDGCCPACITEGAEFFWRVMGAPEVLAGTMAATSQGKRKRQRRGRQ